MNYEKSAQAIVVYKNSVLTTQELIYGNVRLSLPKGHIEKGEDLIDCAIRETREETGVILLREQFVKYIPKYKVKFKTPNGIKIVKTIFPLLFIVQDMGRIEYQEKRIIDIEYMDMDDFINKCSYVNVRKIMLKVTKYFRKQNKKMGVK